MAFSPSPALLNKFRQIAEQRLDRIAEGVSGFAAGPVEDDVVKLGRELHTLKGESGMLGFKGAFEVARALEPLLRSAFGGAQVDERCATLLQRGLVMMRGLIRAEPAAAGPDAEEFVRVARATIGADDA